MVAATETHAGRTFADLLALLDATPAWQRSPVPIDSTAAAVTLAAIKGTGGLPPNSVHPTDQQIDTFTDSEIAKALQIDVLGRTPDARLKIYSEFYSRTVMVRDVAKLRYEDLLLHFGTPVRRVVSRTNEDNAPGMHPIRDVREALAHLGSYRMIGEETELGLGCWPSLNSDFDPAASSESPAIVLVNTNEAAHWNGVFRRITHPRHGNNLLAFETGAKPWYEFDAMTGLLQESASQPFRFSVVDDLVKLFGRWRWRGVNDATIAAGLAIATWVQSLWEWRPRIDVLGASNTGKSMFCAALAGLFPDLCILTSDTTAAGLRQKIQNRMLAVIVDEVDAKNRTKMARQREILEMLRSASRGTAAIRGSGHQQAVEFTLRHLVWVAGITLSYDDQADRNRAICLNLLPPTPEMAGKLTLPPASDLAALGQRTLAAALWAIQAARRLAVRLKDTKIDGVDARLIESYAVPAAILAIVLGYDDKAAGDFLVSMLEGTKADTPVESDESNLIGEILRAKVQLHNHRLTVGQALELILDVVASNRDEWKLVLEGNGIKVGVFGYGETLVSSIPKGWEMKRCLMMNYQTVRNSLLKGTRWEGQPIDQVIRRLPHCMSAKRRVGGVLGRVAMLPLDLFVLQYIGEKEEIDSIGNINKTENQNAF